MRVKALLLAGLLGVVGFPGTSHAEKVRTNDSAKVYNRPGEQGKIIVKVKEGQVMTVLAKEGRWLKVRVSGRTGFIPRSKVDMPENDEEFSRNTRRRPFVDGRGTKRTFGNGGDAPDDRIGADATGDNVDTSKGDDDASDEPDASEEPEPVAKKPKGKKPPKEEPKEEPEAKDDAKDEDTEDPIAESGTDEEEPADAAEEEEEPKDLRKRARVASKTQTYAEASKSSDKQFMASPKQVLYVESTDGKWTEVSVDDGDIGWIQTSKLEMEEGGDEDEGGGGGGSSGRMIDVRARFGVTFFGQTMSSTGGTGKFPDAYTIGSTTAAISLGGALLYPYKKNYVVGGEVVYDYAKALPGIAFDPDGQAGEAVKTTTGFTLHNFNLRGLFGYDFHKKNGMIVFGRLAAHYEAILFENVGNLMQNQAKLPSESIKGPMIGVSFAVPSLTPKIGLRVNADAIVIGGSVSQTKNLEDGQNPSVKKYVLGAGITYRLRPGWAVNGGYDLNYASISWDTPMATSMRGHTGTAVQRKDTNHTISVGIAKAF